MMWRYKRLAWISGGCVAILIIVWVIRLFQSAPENVVDEKLPAPPPSLQLNDNGEKRPAPQHDPLPRQVQVQARCGVAAGDKISGDRAQITCGLAMSEIEEIITHAVQKFDLPALIDQAQQNQIKDLKAIEALSEKLGLTPEATLNILKLLKNPEPAPVSPNPEPAPVSPDIKLAVLIAPYTHIVVDRPSPAPKLIPMIPEPPRASREEMREEIKQVFAECAVAAGAGVELKSLEVKCGPNKEEIGVIIERVAGETNLAGLLQDLRHGLSPDGNSLKKLAEALHLTQNSLLGLLTLLARSDTPPYQISTELTTVVKKHIALAQRVGAMRQDDAILQNMSDHFYAAVAASDFTRAEALLRDYEVARSVKENADKAMAEREEQHQQTLANIKKEEADRRNLLQAEHAKALSELKEARTREPEKQDVRGRTVAGPQPQSPVPKGTDAAPKHNLGTPPAGPRRPDPQPPPQEDVYEQLKLFTEVLSYMETNYVDAISLKDVMYSAIHGLMKKGDPDGSFMSPELYKEMQDEAAQSSAGVGLELIIRDDNLLVVAPLEDSPAFRGGIQPEDHIIKIDGVSTKGMTLVEAVRKLRGPEGTPVTLSILRKDATESKDWTFTREFTVIKNVRWNRLQDGIAYIRLRSFHKTTADELEEALQELDEENLQGLVLDLRNNPGGLLEHVLAVADRFLEGEKLIVYTKGRAASQNIKVWSNPKVDYRDYPMIVLVNKGSAAGAEIVAGALQDLGRARILGTPTFGKGTIQTIIPLSKGAGLRLTTAWAFTPKGHAIHGRGIIPDISEIPGELPNPENGTGKAASGVTLPPTRSHYGDLTTDIQLQRAVEVLRAKN